MFVQAHKYFTARLAKLVVGQFDISLSSHRGNVPTQSGIGRSELGTPDRVLQSLAIETIQLANAAQPPKSPGRQLRVAFAHSHKVAADVRPTECQQQLSLFDLLHRFVAAVAIDHHHTQHGVGKVRLRHIVTAARIEYINDGIFACEQPQPPQMTRFPGLFHENFPACLVGLKVCRQHVTSPNRLVERCEQWLDALQSVVDRSRREAQSQQPKLLDGAMSWPLQVKLFQQQMNPQAGAIDTLGKELRRQRRGDGSRLIPTVASTTITFAANDSTIDRDFNFELFAIVAVAEVFQRLATASTNFGLVGQVDLFLTCRQVRVVSSLGRGASRLLSAFLLGRCLLLRIIEIIGAIGGGLLFRLFAETLGFELSNLGPGLIEFGLQLGVSFKSPSMPALPVACFSPKVAHLLPELAVFTTQLADFLLQPLNKRRQ